MKNADFDEFVMLWKAMRESYPHAKPISDMTISLEFEALKSVGEIADIRRALSSHKRNDQDGMFAPTAAHLMKYIRGDSESRSLSAWTMVERAVQSVGNYESVVFPEPAIMAAIIDMGGWLELCKVTEKELPFKKQEFVKRYNGYMVQPPREWPRHLPGLAELSNQKEFPDHVPDPKLIGDTQKCLAVFHNGSDNKPRMVSLKEATKDLPGELGKLTQRATRTD